MAAALMLIHIIILPLRQTLQQKQAVPRPVPVILILRAATAWLRKLLLARSRRRRILGLMTSVKVPKSTGPQLPSILLWAQSVWSLVVQLVSRSSSIKRSFSLKVTARWSNMHLSAWLLHFSCLFAASYSSCLAVPVILRPSIRKRQRQTCRKNWRICKLDKTGKTGGNGIGHELTALPCLKE